jgi:hypothetical protein
VMTLAFKVEVFLNRQEDEDGRLAIFTRFRDESAYQEGDKLELVLTTTVAGDSKDDVLNKVFALTNRGSGMFIGDDAYPERSLSVGDVVALDRERFSVESVGFKALACSHCGGDPCYTICPENPDYYSPERERADSDYNDSLSESEWMSAAARQYEREHGEPYCS